MAKEPTMSDQCRDAFEKWTIDVNGWWGEKALQKHDNGEYAVLQTSSDWKAWQAAYNASRWIPVKERLPEPMEKVWTIDIDHPQNSQKEAHVNNDGEWFTNRGYVDVTHWQPLPEAPK
jgi:hypothetical protein